MKLIKLSQGLFTMVDDADYEWLSQFRWYAIKKKTLWYAVSKSQKIRMHRLILGLTDRKILVDHRDHNGLNNQRYNLRQANHAQNRHNSSARKGASSKFKGVSWNNEREKWRAQIFAFGKKTSLGNFKLETDAAIAYNNAAKELHGEFAHLNSI